MKKIVSVLIASVLIQGCTHLASVSSSSIPKAPQRNKPVMVEAKKMIFMGFNFNNDYLNDMAFRLANQCPNGKIQGVVTKHENVLYFGPFLYEVRVSATGFCTRG